MAVNSTTFPFGMNNFNTFGLQSGLNSPFGFTQNQSIFNDDFLANATFNTPSFTSNTLIETEKKDNEDSTKAENQPQNAVTLSNTTPTVLGGLGIGAGTYLLTKPNIIKDGKFAEYILKAASESEVINGVLKADISTEAGKTALNNEILNHWDDSAKAFKKDAPEALTKAVKTQKLLKAGKYGLITAAGIWLLTQMFGSAKINT